MRIVIRWVLIVAGLILAVVALLIVAVLTSDRREKIEGESSPRIAVAPRLLYSTTARKLYQDYETNEVATDQKIGNAVVEVYGVIESIDKDFTDSAVVRLATGNEFMPASMTLLDSQKTAAAALSKGQRITVLCEKMQRIVGTPIGTNCTLLPPADYRKSSN